MKKQIRDMTEHYDNAPLGLGKGQETPGYHDERSIHSTATLPATEEWSEHVCYILAQGLDLEDVRTYRALVENPRFQCGHCHHTARCTRNLCVPERVVKPGPPLGDARCATSHFRTAIMWRGQESVCGQSLEAGSTTESQGNQSQQ
jgi:hypothetical protein